MILLQNENRIEIVLVGGVEARMAARSKATLISGASAGILSETKDYDKALLFLAFEVRWEGKSS